MKFKYSLLVILFALFFGLGWQRSNAAEGSRRSAAGSANLIPNAGQFDPAVRFQGNVAGAVTWLANEAFWLAYPEPGTAHPEIAALRLYFGQELDWQPLNPTEARLNLYAGDEPSGWYTGLPIWSGARAALPGGGQLEVTGAGLFIRAGVSSLDFVLEGAVPVVGEALAARLPWGEQPLPLSWQGDVRLEGRPLPKSSGFSISNGGPSDQLVWGTYIGGALADEGEAVVIGPGGEVVLSGQTQSLFFPTAAGIYKPVHAVESFIARLDPTGAQLDYVTVFIGDVEDWAPALALDSIGNAYLAGRTDSTDFPTTPGAYDEDGNGGFDAYLVKLDTEGQIVFSTLLGGGDDEFTNGVVVDETGAATLTGATFSAGSPPPAFPTTADAYEGVHNGGRDVFLARFSPDGSDLVYSTFIGGSGNDHGEAIARSGSRFVVAGWTTSADFDIPAGGYDTVKSGSFDAFVLSLTPGSTSLDFWTYLGGTDGPSVTGERALALLLASDGSPVVAGSTVAADFPVSDGAFDELFGGGVCLGFPCTDGFVAKLTPNGDDLVWATFIGGEPNGSGLCDATNQDYGDCDDEVGALAWTPSGEILLAGVTASSNFPVTPGAFDLTLDGATDGLVARLNGGGSALSYASFLGGSTEGGAPGDDGLNGVSGGPGGLVAVTGWSNALDFPTTPGSFDPNSNGDLDVAVALLLPPQLDLPFSVFLPLVRR